jgi:hypothetical protein
MGPRRPAAVNRDAGNPLASQQLRNRSEIPTGFGQEIDKLGWNFNPLFLLGLRHTKSG